MIKAVTVTNFKNEKLRMELSNPDLSGIIIKDITGIGGNKAEINSSSYASGDGAWFESARISDRNIVFTFMPMLKPMVEDMRHLLYRYFPVKKKCRLDFETDRRECYIEGYVESNDPNIFSKEVEQQVSIICPDPYFKANTVNDMGFAGVHAKFEFPFSNESKTQPLLEFGEYRTDTRATLVYDGEEDTGIDILIHCLGEVKNLTIHNIDTLEKMIINTDKIKTIASSSLGAGDDILISTVRGRRGITYVHDGTSTNILAALNKDADWFQLVMGDNTFEFVAESGQNLAQMTISYQVSYGGV